MPLLPCHPNAEPVELNTSPEKVCYIISRARLFDVKVELVEPEPVSTPIDTEGRDVLADYPGDPTTAELREAIDDLNDDDIVDLIALAWGPSRRLQTRRMGGGVLASIDWAVMPLTDDQAIDNVAREMRQGVAMEPNGGAAVMAEPDTGPHGVCLTERRCDPPLLCAADRAIDAITALGG